MLRPTQATVVDWLRTHGPSSSVEICRGLSLTQPSFSRLVKGSHMSILRVGRARATRYAAIRQIDGVASPVPIYEIGQMGEAPRTLGRLHPVHPDGFWFESDLAPSRFFEDLPYFLHDMRPAGFLGRLIPKLHPGLGPTDINLWSAQHTLRYLSRHAWDAMGALVVGEVAYTALLQNVGESSTILPTDRVVRYPQLADNALQHGPIGSSAGGEQPKFLATVGLPTQRIQVLIKFSPREAGTASTRWADLLIAEHQVHAVLRDAGHPAPSSEIVQADDRTFLEITRFDRPAGDQRIGQISLAALDAEFVGSDLSSWIQTTEALLDQRRIDKATHDQTRWLHLFGQWIANADMHHGNLSFHTRGLELQGLTPTYDMLPMLYRPTGSGEVVERSFTPPSPSPADADIARSAWTAALTAWNAIAEDARVSPDFQAIARANTASLEALEPQIDLLPTG